MLGKWLRTTLGLGIVFPFFFLLVLSLGQQWMFPAIWPAQWAPTNWWLALRAGLLGSLMLSLFLSVSIAVVATGLGFWLGRWLAYRRAGQPLLLLAYLPYVFAPVILAVCLQFYFLRLGGSGTLVGVWIAQLFITVPYALIFFSSFWNERLRAMEQLVYTLGGSPAQALRRVLLPIARGPLLVAFFQTFLISWFEYGLTQFIGVGKVATLTVQVFQYVNEANIFYAALASLLLTLPPVLLLWINKRYILQP